MKERAESRGEQLLREVLVGDRQRDDPEVRSLAETDPRFAQELETMLRTVEDLSAAAELERAVLGDCVVRPAPEAGKVGTEQDAPGEKDVERFLRGLIAEEPGTGETRPRSRLLLLLPMAAAAALLFLLYEGRAGDGNSSTTGFEGPGEDLILGGGDLALSTPRGDLQSFAAFRWEGDLDPGQRFEVRVIDPASGAELHAPVQVDGNEWLPDAGVHEAWPDSIAWEVSRVSVLNEIERTSGRTSATRLRR